MLIEKGLPKVLWPLAVQAAAHIRNRCYNDRIKSTPYFMMTGRKPNLSKMWIFGSDCYAYKHDHKKLDPRCEKGMFVGYSKNSPAYLVYNAQTGKISKHRLVKFVRKNSTEKLTQTDEDEFEVQSNSNRKPDSKNSEGNTEDQVLDANKESVNAENTEVSGSDETMEKVAIEDEKNNAGPLTTISQKHDYSKRERKAPRYLEDYVTCSKEDVTNVSVDYCYRAVCGVPQTYREALMSPEALGWERAMKEEIHSLKENDTFELTILPEGRKTVGGRWVYALKDNAETGKIFKARYVAKGYNQTEGIDYHETFAPTANLQIPQCVH